MATELTITSTIFLAIIQGLTEFLPISSSAHLILTKYLFNIKDSAGYLDLILHIGSLGAVLFYFRKHVKNMIGSWFYSAKDTEHKKLSLYLIVATIPICLIAYLFSQYLPLLRTEWIIAWASILGSILLVLSYFFNKHQTKILSEMNYTDALIIGLFQSLALIPGSSRTGMAMAALLLLGFSVYESALFSILLGIPTLLAGGFYLALQLHQVHLDISIVMTALFVSFITAIASIHILLSICRSLGVIPFVIYRIILGIFILFVI